MEAFVFRLSEQNNVLLPTQVLLKDVDPHCALIKCFVALPQTPYQLYKTFRLFEHATTDFLELSFQYPTNDLFTNKNIVTLFVKLKLVNANKTEYAQKEFKGTLDTSQALHLLLQSLSQSKPLCKMVNNLGSNNKTTNNKKKGIIH